MILNVIGKTFGLSLLCIIIYLYTSSGLRKYIILYTSVQCAQALDYWVIQILNLRPSAYYIAHWLIRNYLRVCTLRKECVSVLLCISNFLVLKQRVISIKKANLIHAIVIVRNHLFYLLQNSEL